MQLKILDKLKLKVRQDRSFLTSFIYTAISRGISGFGTMAFSFILARYLGITSYGQFMLAYSILTGLGIVSKFGMDQALLKYASILFHENDKGTLQHLRKEIFIISTIASIVLAVVFYLLRNTLSQYLFGTVTLSTMLVIMAINLPFYSNILMQSTYLKAFRKPEIAPFLEIGLLAFLTAIFVVIGAQFGVKITPYSASIILFIATIVVLIVGQLILEKSLREFYKNGDTQKRKVKGFYRSLPDFALSTITTYLLNFSPGIILGIYSTSKDVGLYSIAKNISFLIAFILAIVNNVTAPYFATYYKNGDMHSLRVLVKNSTMYMLLIALPVFLIIVLFPVRILHVFGYSYLPAKNALILLAAAQFFNVLTGPIYFLLNMTGHQKYLRNNVLVTAIITIVFSIIFSKLWGFWGASVATAIGLVLQNAFAYYYANKFLGIKLYGRISK